MILSTPRSRLPQTPDGTPAKPKNRRNRANPMGAQRSNVLPGNQIGDLIEQARIDMDISQVEAAARANMHANQWRATVRMQKSDLSPNNPLPRTWARCAVVVGLTPKKFREIGRDDIADEMVMLGSRPVTISRDEPMSLLDQLIEIRDSFGPEPFWAAIDLLLKSMRDGENDPGRVAM